MGYGKSGTRNSRPSDCNTFIYTVVTIHFETTPIITTSYIGHVTHSVNPVSVSARPCRTQRSSFIFNTSTYSTDYETNALPLSYRDQWKCLRYRESSALPNDVKRWIRVLFKQGNKPWWNIEITMKSKRFSFSLTNSKAGWKYCIENRFRDPISLSKSSLTYFTALVKKKKKK